MPYKDFREFLDFLEKKGELKTCQKEVDTEIEIAKITDKSSKVEGPAILFTNVKGFDTQVVTGLFGNLDRGFLMMDSNKYEAFNKVALAMENMIPLNLLNDGPCQEIVKVKNDIDLNEIPTLWHHRKDSHRFITTANCRVKDPVTKICNSSINRIAVLGKDRLTFQSNPPHQLAIIARQYLEKGLKCPIALSIGTDPSILVGSVCGVPPGTDEFEFAGGLRGAAVDVVKCLTSDIEIPAYSELVIEGEIVPGDEDGAVGKTSYEFESPFCEIHGYFGMQARSPVIQVTAISHRKNYIYHGLGTAEPPSEHQIFDAVGVQGDVYLAIKKAFPKLKIGGINAGSFAAIISMRKTEPGQARQLIEALLAKAGLKRVTVVDEDIDVFNPTQVDWAIQFRSCADDYILTSELPAINLDPMISTPPNLLKKVGIDATLPLKGDKTGVVEVLKDLGPARYSDLDSLDLKDYIDI
tara:strand:- start:417 stop:1817 length:1401 start_codon:yes stop_codon:yes gene_type:complete